MFEHGLPRQLAGIRKDYESIVGREAAASGWGRMIQTGRFLKFLAASKPGVKILELGTGFGFSAAWFLAGMDRGSKLISVEISPQIQAIAKKHFRRERRIEFVLNDAAVFLSRNKKRFDFVFADAIPGKFKDLHLALDAVNREGLCVMDDMTPLAEWSPQHGKRVKNLVSNLRALTNFCVIPLKWGTGLTLLARTSDDS